MDSQLPTLYYQDLLPTLTAVQNAAKVLGKLQQAFTPLDEHEWNKGLTPTVTGLTTAPLGSNTSAQLNMVQGEVTVGDLSLPLADYPGYTLVKPLQEWAQEHGGAAFEQPVLSASAGNWQAGPSQAMSVTVSWCAEQFRQLKNNLTGGTSSPVLLYPHHFDLSLVWYPHNDERQVGLGFSFGDSDIAEPYFYMTVYPEPANFQPLVPPPAFRQTGSFSGVVLKYADLRRSDDPGGLLAAYTEALFDPAASIFS